MCPIIFVGAIYLDTILTVPHYPDEDKKLRATNISIRRGGNCGNSLEVLEQLVKREVPNSKLPWLTSHDVESPENSFPLYLITVLPGMNTEAAANIQASFKCLRLNHTCIYRGESTTAASSYIIKSQQNGSRTIVSYNGLEEMTLDEFEQKAAAVLSHAETERGWFHFEVRYFNRGRR